MASRSGILIKRVLGSCPLPCHSEHVERALFPFYTLPFPCVRQISCQLGESIRASWGGRAGRPAGALWLHPTLEAGALRHCLSVRTQASRSASHSTTAAAPNGSVTTGPLLPALRRPYSPLWQTAELEIHTEPSAGHRQGTPGLRTKGGVCITDNPGPLANVSIDGIRFLNQNRIPKILFVHGHRDQERRPLTYVCLLLHSRWVPPSPAALYKRWFYILNQAEVHRSNACLSRHPKWILAFVYL